MVDIRYEKFTLSNGLDVILHEDHSLPLVAVNVWYHVGSKDEEAGRTGFAHLFEHVMFEGSKHHNRSYFDSLEEVGADLNGSTTVDRTNYWENVPSNYLELALWLESDRMGFLLDALDQKRFDVQRDVVKNERRQSYENRPYAMAHLLLPPAVFPSPHPYGWSTIGSPGDLDAADLDDVKEFFQRYYTPPNASLAIVGDFDEDEAARQVERYFGDIPPTPIGSRMSRMDSELKGQVSLAMLDKVQLSRLYLVWPSVPEFDRDQAPLDMLSVVLGDGKSSRLYRDLVYERQIAHDVAVYHHAQEIAGEFHVQVTAAPGKALAEIEDIVRDEIGRVAEEAVTDRELARARNRIESQYVRQLERFGGFGGRADLLNHYNTMTGDPGLLGAALDRYEAVTAADVKRAAAATLNDGCVRLCVLPEERLRPSSSSIDREVKPEAQGAPSFTPPVPVRALLSNGLDVVFLEKRGLPLQAFGMLVRAGAVADERDKPGLGMLTASMLVEGTSKRSSREIADEMEFLGARIMTSPNREYVLLSAEVLASHWPAAMELASDVLVDPTFPVEEFDRVRKELLVDLRRVPDNPMTIAARAWRALLYGPASPYGHPSEGTEASIESMSREVLERHYTGHYSPGSTTLIVVGEASHDEVMSQAEARFGAWAAGTGARSPGVGAESEASACGTLVFLADKPGAAQSVIRAGHLTVPRHHPDYFALTLLNYIFGGQFSARLNMNLRQDKGYSYGYLSSIDWFTGPSSLVAGGGVETSVTKEAVAETLKEFAEIRGSRPVTNEEFDIAKSGILRSLPSQFETQRHLLQQLTRLVAFDLPLDYYANYAANLSATSLDDVRRAAEERLDDSHLKVLVVGDAEAVEPGLRELGLQVVRVDHDGNQLS